jgi:hypothetical protein
MDFENIQDVFSAVPPLWARRLTGRPHRAQLPPVSEMFGEFDPPSVLLTGRGFSYRAPMIDPCGDI